MKTMFKVKDLNDTIGWRDFPFGENLENMFWEWDEMGIENGREESTHNNHEARWEEFKETILPDKPVDGDIMFLADLLDKWDELTNRYSFRVYF